jgi:hypothetical protein
VTSLVALISLEAIQELSGLGLFISILLAIPLILAVIAVFLIIRRKKVKIFLLISGFIMTIYSFILFLLYSLGKFAGKEVEINYSFTVSFYLYILTSFIVFALGIILPEDKLIEKNQFITLRKEIKTQHYNNAILFANIVLLIIFLFTPILKYNRQLLYFMDNSDSVNSFLTDNIKIDKFISLVKIIMTVGNRVLKIIPIVLITLYLLKNRKTKEYLKPNKPAIVYILVVFGALWSLVKTINSIVVISSSMLLAVGISAALLLPDVLASRQFKATIEKTQSAACFIKEKSASVIKNLGKTK